MTRDYLFVNLNIILALMLSSSLKALDSKKLLCDGIEYTHLQTRDPIESSLHLVTIDPKKVILKLVKAENACIGLNQTTKLAQHTNAVAAINGGFFSSQGIPAGIMKIEDRWFTDSHYERAALGWKKDGTSLINHITSTWKLTIGNIDYRADRLNQRNNSHQAILYSSLYAHYIKINTEDLAIIIVDNTVVALKRNNDTIHIPHNGYVFVVGHHSKIDTSLINIGMKVEITTMIKTNKKEAPEWNTMDYIIGGTPLLIKNSKKITDFTSEKIQKKFITQHDCRTAVGILPNGHWLWVVIDARDNHNGRGVTLHELADIMEELGCVDALNLCGGKSSTLVIQGSAISKAFSFGFHEFVNFEFLAGEKLVSDALVAIKNL